MDFKHLRLYDCRRRHSPHTRGGSSKGDLSEPSPAGICYPHMNHAEILTFSLPQAAADGYKETGPEKVPQAKGYRACPGTGSGLSWSVSRPGKNCTDPLRRPANHRRGEASSPVRH